VGGAAGGGGDQAGSEIGSPELQAAAMVTAKSGRSRRVGMREPYETDVTLETKKRKIVGYCETTSRNADSRSAGAGVAISAGPDVSASAAAFANGVAGIRPDAVNASSAAL